MAQPQAVHGVAPGRSAGAVGPAAVLTSTARVVALAVTAVATLLLLAVVVVPQLLGAQPLGVLSGSMAPAISAGDVVVVRPTAPDDLAVGDVVSYAPRPGPGALPVTHRIVGRRTVDGQAMLLTKGDANDGVDADLVPVGAVQGRILYAVPFVGHLREQVPAQGLLVILALLGLVGYVGLPLAARPRDEEASAARDDGTPARAGDTSTLAAVPRAPHDELTPSGAALAGVVGADLVRDDQADVLLAVLPLGLAEPSVDDALRAWRHGTPPTTPEPVRQALRSGAVVVAAAGRPDDLNALARSLSDLVARRPEPDAVRSSRPAAAAVGPHAGRSARDVVLD